MKESQVILYLIGRLFQSFFIFFKNVGRRCVFCFRKFLYEGGCAWAVCMSVTHNKIVYPQYSHKKESFPAFSGFVFLSKMIISRVWRYKM